MSRHPPLSQVQKEKLWQEGIHFFNTEEYFEAHEAWEVIWLQTTTNDKKLYQGMIQLAAAYHHHQKGNLKPATSCLMNALKKLESADHFWGLDLKKIVEQLQQKPFVKMWL